MRILPPCSARLILVGAASLALASGLAACSSKTPLIQDTGAVGGTAKPLSAAEGVQTMGPTGARKFLGVFAPYRVDVQQGNFISREMVNQLNEGMQRPEGVTREQVRFVLGTPLVTDIFHAERWDYVFRLQKRSGEVITSRVAVFFDGDRVSRIESGNLPTEQEYLAFIAGGSAGQTK